MLITLFITFITLYLVIDFIREPARKARREAYLKATLSNEEYASYTARKILMENS
jgi:hypothetical protein